MIGPGGQQVHHLLPISASQDGNEERQEHIYAVGLVEILDDREPLCCQRIVQYQHEKGRGGINWRHPEHGQNLPLDDWLVHVPQMGCQMPKEYHDAEDGEGCGSLHKDVFGRDVPDGCHLLLHALLDVHHGGVEDVDR